MAFSQLHAQLQILLHDGLVNLLPGAVLLALDDIAECIKSPLLLPHIDELCQNYREVMETLLKWTPVQHLNLAYLRLVSSKSFADTVNQCLNLY